MRRGFAFIGPLLEWIILDWPWRQLAAAVLRSLLGTLFIAGIGSAIAVGIAPAITKNFAWWLLFPVALFVVQISYGALGWVDDFQNG